eukprot:TRINITY_DN24140_c0_g1_i1.p1 TRINITY_DN24140_c0_g1~~TRINITY_DN24140_c0_g1_i1.p1  ORF type:complete len:641 (+),score=145.85 TRINITY_DN24140_c0_g1_i1:195-2117(+)
MASSLKEYLKKYTSEPDNNNNKKKKKKKPKNPANAKNIESGVRIVDEDPVWQAEVKDASSEDEDSPDEKPLIMEDVEIKRLKRLEQLRTRKPYLAVADDGSGWVTVSEPKKTENDNITSVSTRDRHDSPDLSPPRKVLSSASDLSPQRKQASRGSPDLSPARKEASKKSSDLSPPRKQQRDKSLKQKDGKWQIPDGSAHLSPSRKSSLRSSDLSPQRKFAKDKIINSNNDGRRARHDSPDLSPPRKAVRNSVELSRSRNKHRVSPDRRETQKRIRHDSPDLSSFRSTSSRSPDLSSPRARHDSPDLSPPRKVVRNSLVLSPSRRKQSDSSRDRRYTARRNRHDSPDLSPPRKVSLRSTSLSPPRNSSKDGLLHMNTEKRIGHHDSPDLSPPRKAVKGLLELSPSRKKQRYSSPDKMEATKRDRHDSPDLSYLQRSSWTSQDLSYERPQKEDKHKILHYEKSVSDNSKTIRRSVDITNAGLLSGEDFKEELDRKRREESDRFRKMDVSISGRSAGTVYRDKHGRKLEGLEEYMQLQKGQPKPEDVIQADKVQIWKVGLNFNLADCLIKTLALLALSATSLKIRWTKSYVLWEHPFSEKRNLWNGVKALHKRGKQKLCRLNLSLKRTSPLQEAGMTQNLIGC